MKMVGITPCYRITLENGSYGVETYINADSKIQITFEDGNTLIGYSPFLIMSKTKGTNFLRLMPSGLIII